MTAFRVSRGRDGRVLGNQRFAEVLDLLDMADEGLPADPVPRTFLG